MTADPDLLARARVLADRLQGESRKHLAWDATMRRMSHAASMEGEPLALDDQDARAGRQLVEDATTIRRMADALRACSQAPHASKAALAAEALLIGLIGAGIMLVSLSALSSLILLLHLSAWLMLPTFLGGPLLGWGLTVALRSQAAAEARGSA